MERAFYLSQAIKYITTILRRAKLLKEGSKNI
jgi:hypothetical protein